MEQDLDLVFLSERHTLGMDRNVEFAGCIIAPSDNDRTVDESLLKLRMTRVGFLGVLISLIVLVLVALLMILDTELQVDAFPVIVCALVVERWWKQVGKDGAKPAAKMAFNTFLLAVVIEFVMVSHFALALIEWSPLLMPAFTAVAIGVLGRYRGLRLSELHRFAPIWLERRRQARARANPDQLELDLELEAEAVIYEERRAAPAPLGAMWVISSPDDLEPGRRRRVPQPIQPNAMAQFEPKPGMPGRPLIHNAWVIRSVEDV